MRILLDLDGTVAQNAGRRLAAQAFGITLSEDDRLLDRLGLSEAEFWAWWHANQEAIYDQAEPLQGAAETIRSLRASGAHVAVVTARRSAAESVTANWLHRHGFEYDQMFFDADDKLSIARALSLNIGFEDDPDNALALADYMPMILIDGRKNRDVPMPHANVRRVSAWAEVSGALRELYGKTA